MFHRRIPQIFANAWARSSHKSAVSSRPALAAYAAAEALVFPGAALLWLGAAFYLAMLGLVAEVALSSERESARHIPTAWEVR